MVLFIPQGRAGNFFMEFFTAFSYAKKHGLEFTVPFKTSSEFWSPIYLKHLQNKNYNPSLPQIRITEPHFHYSPIPFNESYRNMNVVLHGYFQSYKYWEGYREDILDAVNFPQNPQLDVCSLHCRYGDYLTIEQDGKKKHIVVDEEYILAAMKLITEKTGITRFKVFSDDLELFKQRHSHLYDFEYTTNKNELEDLIEISNCHSHINSSSTFSYVGAWLNRNPDKVIITQFTWFNANWDNADTSDLIPSSWIKL